MRIEDVQVGMKLKRTHNPPSYIGRMVVGGIYTVSYVDYRNNYLIVDGMSYFCSPKYFELAVPVKRPLSGFGRFVKVQREKDAYAPL